jgi:KDO2-lipid IV(A) lauroyltransferase
MITWLTGRVFYLTTWIGFTLGSLAVRFLPRHWLYGFTDLVTKIGFYCFVGFRTRSIANIRAVFGEQLSGPATEEIARRSLGNFMRSCTEMAIALEASEAELRALISLAGREHLDAALAKGSGVLVLSAHIGNFFLVGSRLAIDGYTVSVLINQPRDRRFAELMDEYRLRVRQKTIHARPRREALKTLSDSLRRNELAVIIADEFRRGAGVEVPLFGRTAIARRGPATVAMRTSAAVVPACLIRQPEGTLKLVIEPELELDRSGKSADQIRENMIRITRWLEEKVREHPDQWNWMNIRWWTTEESRGTQTHAPARQAI